VNESLVVDDFSVTLRRSAKRRTLGISIDRDGGLVVNAPVDCSTDQIKRAVNEKSLWIYTRLAEKELTRGRSQPKEFVSGEGFYYLGRSYRLILVEPASSDPSVAALQLHHGRFMLRHDQLHRAHQHFVKWYIRQGRPWIQYRVDLLAGRIGVVPGPVEVRDLGFRWGSSSRSGGLNFHWRAILLPPRIVEYIVAHELVHLRERHHNREFWRTLERAMPDFAARKRWLAENGGRYS
jgi:predicted metal-dependent hydrolase